MDLPQDANKNPVPVLKLGTAQNLTIGVSSVQSNAFSAGVTVVRVIGTGACRIAIGSNPTATATGTYLAPEAVEYFEVAEGDKIAVIGANDTGDLSVTECD